MKKQCLIHICQVMSIYRMESRMFLMEESTYTDRTIDLEQCLSVKMIM